MKKTLQHYFAGMSLAVLLGSLPVPAAAQLFVDIAPSARARGLGEAVTASASGPWSYYYNPGMLPRLQSTSLGAATTEPNNQDFNRLTTIAISHPLKGFGGGVGFGWRHYGVDYQDVDLETENTLSFAHGFMLFTDASTSASVGWALNLFHLDFASSVGSGDGSDGIDPGNAWSFGVDIGGVVTLYDRTYVAFMARNLNSATIGVDNERLQQQVSLGIAYQPYPGVTTSMDVRNGLGDEFRLMSGVEFEVVPQLVVRAGLQTEPNKLTGGVGVNLDRYGFDYGFSTGGGILESSHQFGLRANIDYWEASE